MLCTAGGAERSYIEQNFAKSLRNFLFCRLWLRLGYHQTHTHLYHSVVNVPARSQSCWFNGLGGVALQRNTLLTSKSFASLLSIIIV